MKKFLIIILISIFSIIPVNAANDIEIESIKYIKSSDGVISNDKENVNVVFNDLNQTINYEAVIKNNTNQKLYVNSLESENSKEKFIEYKLDSKSENMVIEPNSSSKVIFHINTLEIEGAGRNLDEQIKVNFLLSDKLTNPNTFSNIIDLIILLSVLVGTMYLVRKNKKVKTLILIVGISVVGIYYVEANDYIKSEIDCNIKYQSQNNIISTGTTLNDKQADYTNAKEVWAYYDKVKNVEVKSLINEPKEYYKKFDLTENKTGRVMAYLVENNDKDTPYDLKIMSKGVVIANKDSSFMFSFPNTEKVEGLTNVDFTNSESMQGMFIGNEKVEELEVSAIPLDNVKNTSYMFYENKNLDITIKDFNTDHIENIEDITYMTQNYLYDIVKHNAKLDEKINYTNDDTATNHLFYKTKDAKNPIYYYRGSVKDNNVKFAGFCWYIVRTTETGGIKLLYNGTPDENGKCIPQNPNATLAGDEKFSASQNHIGAVGYMYGERIPIKKIQLGKKTENIKYGNDIIYDEETKMYTLVDIVSTSDWNKDMKEIIKNHHYSCFNETEQCSTVNYIISASNYYYENGTTVYYGDNYYVEIKNGDDIDDVIKKANENINDSNAKYELELWYEKNLLDYTDKIEDTIWCNDRKITNGLLVGKDSYMENNYYNNYFDTMNRIYYTLFDGTKVNDISLTCSNENDRFTVSKEVGNGSLKYPIALLTADESALIGGTLKNNDKYIYTNNCWWVMSSSNIEGDWTYGFRTCSTSLYSVNINVTGSTYLRPSISLKPGTQFLKGNGTHESPYIIEEIEIEQ